MAYAAGLHHESLFEGGADLQVFALAQAHQVLVKVYCDHLHQQDGTHLEWGVSDDDIWKWRWRRLAANSAIWNTTPSRVFIRRFTACLVTE